ncbi:MAG: ABC transporter ATP-binding protein [Pseudomonadota bacterium]|nr:ABC transporter ATP-binding protein [Pseudomonadota bacterium]
MAETVIRADALRKVYGQGETELVALRDVSIAVERGEVAALLGPSGSGKSTLLTALGLLNLPEQGRIWLADRAVVVNGAALVDLAAVRRSTIGFVFQKANLIPFLTARENVVLALQLNDQRGSAADARARELLGYLGIADRADHLPEQLSGGQQQRVAIARALANRPPLILADEPTAALDSHRGRDVMELFKRIAHEQGAAVIVVTHDHRTLDVFDTIHEMEDGVLSRRPTRAPSHASEVSP